MKTLVIRFGKPHQNKIAAFDLDVIIFEAAKQLGISKTEAKRYLDQEAVYIYFQDFDPQDLRYKN